MKFKDEYHETLFRVIMQKMSSKDEFYTPVAYLIALDSVCQNHVEEIFDFKRQCIKPECFKKPWQTSTSKKTTRLAFNLWNGANCSDGETYTDKDGYERDLPSRYYSVSAIFCCSYAPYYWEAVKIRYPKYTDPDEWE